MTYEVECPACGAVMEAHDIESLIQTARRHTLDAHRYDIPTAHVMQAAVRVPR